MRVIFLDFDGVLNNAEWMKQRFENNKEYTRHSWLERKREELDPACVKMISDLAIETDSNIVIISSWRILFPLHELCDFLEANGLDPSVAPKSVTPQSSRGFRGQEVADWLQSNPQYNIHVIFDDDGDFYPHQPLVKTTWDRGLLPEHIEQARKILLNID